MTAVYVVIEYAPHLIAKYYLVGTLSVVGVCMLFPFSI
jgi:hypothetical protein